MWRLSRTLASRWFSESCTQRRISPRGKMFSDSLIKSAGEICSAALAGVSPSRLVQANVRVEKNTRSRDSSIDVMCVDDKEYPLNHNVKVVAFGKAVLGMLEALEELLGDHLVGGIASVPVGSIGHYSSHRHHKVRIIEGAANNLPDQEALKAAREILEVCSSAREGEIVVAVISGGGSALLPCPIQGIELKDKRKAIELLARAGANIHELNAFRKYFSRTKGGKLAKATYPAQMVGLILSDVIGDPLDIIASGPTVPSFITSSQITSLLEKYNLSSSIPASIREIVRERKASLEDSDKVAEMRGGRYGHVQNIIIGSNRIATEAAADKASSLSYQPIIWSHSIHGEAKLVGEMYATLVQYIFKYGVRGSAVEELKKTSSFLSLIQSSPAMATEIDNLGVVLSTKCDEIEGEGSPCGLCLISGGEPTVTVRGGGKGGRNQELALAFSLARHHLIRQTSPEERPTTSHECECVLISLGTDGQDGPTDAAGAIGHKSLIPTAMTQKLDGKHFLERNDSYSFFSQFNGGRYLLKTGLTGTNVMDIHCLLFEKPIL